MFKKLAIQIQLNIYVSFIHEASFTFHLWPQLNIKELLVSELKIMPKSIDFCHFPFSLPRIAWNAFHWNYCNENLGISVKNVLFKIKINYNTELAYSLQMYHNAIDSDKAKKQPWILGWSEIFTKWRNF